MGSGLDRIAYRLAGLWFFLAFAAGVSPSPAEAAPWPYCSGGGREDPCDVQYLNVKTSQGDASLTIDRACRAPWRHSWRQADAHQTILQWLDAQATAASAGVCIPLASQVTEIRVSPAGGHCGYEGSDANTPGAGGVLRRGGAGSLSLTGCHAGYGEIRFGGIALRFADGYGFGDSYASGYFYGVYDGFGNRAVGQTAASVWRISEYNTFHYVIEILAGGVADWRQPVSEEARVP